MSRSPIVPAIIGSTLLFLSQADRYFDGKSLGYHVLMVAGAVYLTLAVVVDLHNNSKEAKK